MRHWPFVHALAECENDRTPEWAAIAAGLVVLGYFDHWIVEKASTEDLDSLAHVELQIEAVRETDAELYRLLGIILDVWRRGDRSGRESAVGPLFAYGSYLEQSCQLPLAQQVYGVIVETYDSQLGGDPLIEFMAWDHLEALTLNASVNR